MNRFALVTLTLVALAALTVAAPIAAAQPQKYTRPLTVVVWKGSLIEVYLNYTELSDQYGFGPKGYQFALGVPGSATPVTTLPILVSDPSGTTYCTVGYVILDIGTGNKDYALWMSSSVTIGKPYIFETSGKKYSLYLSTSEDDPYYYLREVRVGGSARQLNIYGKVYFPDKGSLEEAIKAANNGEVPSSCQPLLDRCAAGCWLPVYGLIVPEDAPLTSGNKYSLLIKTTASTTWAFEGGLYVLALNPAAADILVKFDAGANNTLAFGRKTDQIIVLADGSKLFVKGSVNVTINWTEARRWLEDALQANLHELNVTVALRVAYRPSVYSLGELIAETGMLNYTYGSVKYANYSVENSLLTNAASSSLPARIYGGQFGTFNKTVAGKAYIVFNLTVNPDAYLPIVNKWLPVTYGGNTKLYMPAAEGGVDLIVRVNETISVTSSVTFNKVGGSITDTVPFWAIAMYLPLGYKLTILPSTIYASSRQPSYPDDFKNAFKPDNYGDSDVLNVYDEVDVVILNFIHADRTKFYIDAERYTVFGAGTSHVERNVSVLLPLIVKSADREKIAEGYVNESKEPVVVGDKLKGSLILINITLSPAQYGGSTFFVVPVFKANLSSEERVVNRVMALLPPVNVTSITTVKNGDVAMADGTTVFRVRPVLFAWSVDARSGGSLCGDTTNAATAATSVILGTYIAVYGVGFNFSDTKLTLWIGNASIPFDQLEVKLNYPLLRGAIEQVVYRFSNGTLLVLVPLWYLYKQGYDPLADATTGLITINVTGSGENSDVAGGSGYDSNAGVFGYKTNAGYSHAQRYEITAPTQPMILVEPRPAVNLRGAAKRLPTNIEIYLPTASSVCVAASLDGNNARNKTATAAYELLRGYNAARAEQPLYYNATHIMLVVITKPATVDTTYAVVMANPTTNEIRAFLVNLTKTNLERGVYIAEALDVPRLPKGTYVLKFYNESQGGLVRSTTSAYVAMQPTVVFYSVETGSADMATRVWGARYPAEITAMPNGTVRMYGFTWDPNSNIPIAIDGVLKATITQDMINESGEWSYEYKVPATAAGSTITLQVGYGTSDEIDAFVKVFEVRRRGLVVTVSTGPVMYEDGDAKLPVIVTATYYDFPVRCVDNPRIDITVYDKEGVPVQKLTEANLKCIADGVWMGTITLKNVETPFYGIIVVRVTHEIRGIATLTQFATTAVTIDPEIKTGIMEAANLASQAAQAANEAKEVAEDVKTMLGDVSDKLDVVTGRLADVSAKVNDIASTVTDIKMTVEEMKKSMAGVVTELGSKLDEIASDVKAVKTAIATLPDQITSAVKAAVAGLPTKDDIKSMIDDVKAAILDAINAAAGKVIDEVKKAAADVKSAVDTAAADIKTAISQSTDRICGRLDKIEAAIKDLSGKVATKNDVEAVKSELAKLGDEVAAKVKETLDKAVSDIKATVQDAVRSIDAVKGKVEEMGGKLSDIDSKVSNLSTNTMLFGAGTLIVSIIVLALLILVAVKSGLLASH